MHTQPMSNLSSRPACGGAALPTLTRFFLVYPPLPTFSSCAVLCCAAQVVAVVALVVAEAAAGALGEAEVRDRGFGFRCGWLSTRCVC